MSKNIEERVVKMRFDNAQFEKNISQSYNSLDKFEQKLNFKGAGKGLQELQKAADTFSMDQLVTQADGVGKKFDAMSVVAISAIQRMTNAAISAGTNMLKSLSVDQVTAGWSKYEEKTGSVQTIMNATGKSIDEVNGYLDKLMWFSDETSYGFNDMTAAIGQLTSAGGDIDKLVPMVMGIANATAFAGKGVNEFSRSIYNLNQSYSAGHLQYMDWKSLELAGVASKQLKEVFIDTAEAMGKVTKGSVTISNFGQTLKDGWADTEVMEAAFGKFGEMTEKAYEMVQSGMVETASEAYEILSETYTGFGIIAAKAAQEAKSFGEAVDATKDAVSSGWMKTFEIIFGNYEEAKVLWTNLANTMWDVFAGGAEARNEMLQFWKDFGGRDSMIKATSNAFNGLYKIILAVKGAFKDVFAPGSTEDQGRRLANLTKAVELFFDKITLSDEAVNTLRIAVKALLVPLNLLWSVIQIGIAGIGALTVKMVQFVDTILAWPSKFKTVSEALASVFGDERAQRMMAIFDKTAYSVSNTFKNLAENAKNFANSINFKGVSSISDAFGKLLNILEPIGGFALDVILDGFEHLLSLDFSWFTDGISKAVDELGKFIKGIDFTKPIDIFKLFVNLLDEFGRKLYETIQNFDLLDKISAPLKKFANVVTGIAEAAQNLLSKLSPVKILVFSFGTSLVYLFFQLGNMVKSFQGVAEGMTSVLKSTSGLLNGATGVLSAFAERIRPNKITQIAVAIGALAASLVILGMVDPERLKAAALAMIEIIGAITIFMLGMAIINKVLVKTPEMAKNLVTMSIALTAMGGSVLALSGALAILSGIDLNNLGYKLLALGGVLAGMVGAAILIGRFAKNLEITSLYILNFSISVWLIVSSLQRIADVDLAGAVPNMLIVASALAIFTVASRGMQKIKFTSMAGLMVFALDILAFMAVLKLMSLADPAGLVAGLINIIPIFTTITLLAIAVRIAGDNTFKMGASLLSVSAAMIILSFALERIGGIPTNVLVKGTVVVGLMMTLFTLMITASGMAGKTLKVGASFMGMAAAILILGVAIDYIGSLSLREAIQGTIVVGTLLVLFGIINAVGNAANGAKGSIVAMSVALGLITASLAILTLLDFKELMGSAVALGLVLATFGLSLNGAKDLKISSAIGTILIMFGAVSILGLMFKYLNGIDWKSTLASATGIGIVMLTLSKSISMIEIKQASLKNISKTILLFTSFLASASIALGLLANFSNPEGIVQKATALGIVMATLSWATSQLTIRQAKIENIGKTILVYTSFLAGASIAIGILSNLANPEGIIQKAVALGTMLLALSTAMTILGTVKALPDVTTTLITMAGMLTFCTIVVAILNALPLNDGLIEKTASLSVLLIAVSAAIAILSKVGLGLSMLGSVAGPALGGFAVAMLMVTAIGAFILAVGAAFEHFASLEPALAKAEVIFPRIGAVIGGFLGSIVGGFIGGIAGGAVEQFGASLSNFATNVQGFLGLKVDQEVVDSIGRLTAVAVLITGAEFLESIARFGRGSSLEAFGKQLSAFGPYFSDFANSLSGIPIEEVNAGSSALEALAKVLAAIPLEGGLIGMIMGEKDLTGFGEGLNSIATALVSYGTALQNSGITQDMVESTNMMMKALVALANDVPKSGGLMSFLGEHNMGTFGTQLVQFITSLKDFFLTLAQTRIDEDRVKAVKNVGLMLTDLANQVPKTGALLDFLGKRDLGAFGEQLGAYATGLETFFTNLKGVTIDEALAKSASTAGKALADVADTIPRTGKMITFFGAKDIGKFGIQIGEFGSGLAAFFGAMAAVSIDESAVAIAKSAGLAFVELGDTLGANTGIAALFSADLGVFGGHVAELGTAMAEYYTSISGIGWETVSKSIDEIARIINLAPLMETVTSTQTSGFKSFLSSLAKRGVDDFTKTFSDSEESIQSSIFTTLDGALEGARASIQANPGNYGFIVDAIITGINSQKGQLTATAKSLIDHIRITIEMQKVSLNLIGSYMINTITEGFERGTETVENAIKRVMEAAVRKAKEILQVGGSQSNAFYQIGQYCVTGFVRGFERNAQQLYTAVTNAGNRVVEKFEEATGVNSPSVKFAEIGMYSVLGYVKGIEDHTTDGTKAMVKMGAKLLNSIKEFFGIHSPSTVTRDEVGRYIVEGIADGITSNMSAEEAAKKKAENIVNAFKTEFDRLASSMTTIDLEYELWQKENPYAKSNQANTMEVEYLDSKLKVSANRVAAAEAQYKATLQSLGENADQTQEAYQVYLQEKINMADLADQLYEIRNSNYDAFREYSNLINTWYDDMTKMGFSKDDITTWAKEQSGWTESLSTGAIPTGSITDMMQRYMEQAQVGAEGVEVVIVQSVQNAVASAVPVAKSGGNQAGTAYTQGVKESIEQTINSDNPLGDLWNAGKEALGIGEESGTGQVEGYINGISSKIGEAKNAVTSWLTGQQNAAKTTDQSHSPSQVYYDIGMNEVLGLTNGISENMHLSTNAISSLCTNLINTTQSAVPQYSGIGTQMMQGLANGISAGKSTVISAAAAVAQQALATTMSILGIHSPSREYYRIGKMIDQGLSNGILDNYDLVAGSLVKITDNMSDMDYTITPIVDTSSIQNANGELDRMSDRWSNVSDAKDEYYKNRDYRDSTILRFDARGNVIPVGMENTSGVQGSYVKMNPDQLKQIRDAIHDEGYKMDAPYTNQKLNDLLDGLRGAATKGDATGYNRDKWDNSATITFTQNISSPKALSTSEIARKTQTGLSKFVNAVSNIKNSSSKG